MSKIYKICTRQEWLEAKEKGVFIGSEIDLKDGYIHFSTKEQLITTYEKYFKEQENLVIFEVNTHTFTNKELVWEIARNDTLFPHLYIPLSIAHVTWTKDLQEAFKSIYPET